MLEIIYEIATLSGQCIFIILYFCMFFGTKQPAEYLKKHPLLRNITVGLVLIGMLRFIFDLPRIIHN